MPARAAGYCVDPNGDVKRYGEGAALSLDSVCVELFNGECEIYKRYGLQSVKTVNYVSERSATISVSAVISSFGTSSGAHGFFTRRVVGDGLPSQATVESFEVTGRAAMGAGVSYLWRGKQVVEMSYVSELETPDEVASSGRVVLSALARATAQGLVGAVVPGPGVLLLERLVKRDFGVVGYTDGLLGLVGTGPFVAGFVESGPEHLSYRLLVAERRDEASADDLMKSIKSAFPFKKLKTKDAYRVRVVSVDDVPKSIFMTQDRERVLVIEPLQVETELTVSTPESRSKAEKSWESLALEKLTELKELSALREG